MPVSVTVEVADWVVLTAVSVVVAEGCAGVRVKADGLAVTPEGRPEIETGTEPLNPFIAVIVTVMALLVAPALRESEPGETAREKSGVGLGAELPPQAVTRQMTTRAATSRSALARMRMSGVGQFSNTDCNAPTAQGVSSECHCLKKGFERRRGADGYGTRGQRRKGKQSE